MRINFILSSLFACMILFSCDPDRVFDEYRSIPAEWNKDSLITFNVTPPDSINAYNVFVNLRNTIDYKYSNLFLIVITKFPHGKVITDTLEYRMADQNGKFLGSGFTDLKENKFWYKEKVVFEESGEYKFSIQHAMRENNEVDGIIDLQGITDVGLRIEKSQN
ncbi:MAG: gliding motility lipoprotein GldH [Flavobacteriaceae bacterium]|nr:gliding motility lipoprotein GldH [Flavobacteriaceae bacterium]